MNKTRRKKTYSPEYKENVVKKAKECGNISAVARELNISPSSIHGWIRESRFAEIQGKGLQFAIDEKNELAMLKKRNEELEEELAIIKKATAYFAQDRLKRNTPGSKK